MTELRDGIGLRAYGQKNPVIEYKRESYDMFEEMVHLIQEDTLRRLYFTVLAKPMERKQVATPVAASHGEEEARKPAKKATVKVGAQRSLPLRQRQEVQEVLRGGLSPRAIAAAR